jgi:hypothetical protein
LSKRRFWKQFAPISMRWNTIDAVEHDDIDDTVYDARIAQLREELMFRTYPGCAAGIPSASSSVPAWGTRGGLKS